MPVGPVRNWRADHGWGVGIGELEAASGRSMASTLFTPGRLESSAAGRLAGSKPLGAAGSRPPSPPSLVSATSPSS